MAERESTESFYSVESYTAEDQEQISDLQNRMEKLFDEIQNSVEDETLLDSIERFFDDMNQLNETCITLDKKLKQLKERRRTKINPELTRKSIKRLSVLPADLHKTSRQKSLAHTYKEQLRESLAEIHFNSLQNSTLKQSFEVSSDRSSKENLSTSYPPMPFSYISATPPSLPSNIPIFPSLPHTFPIPPSLPSTIPIPPSLPSAIPVSPSNIPIPPSLPSNIPIPPSLPTCKNNQLKYKTLFWDKLNISVENTVFDVCERTEIPQSYIDYFRVEDRPQVVKKPQVNLKIPSLDIKRDLAISTVLKVLNKNPRSLVSDILNCNPTLIEDIEKLSLLHIIQPKDTEIEQVQAKLTQSVSLTQAEQMISLISSIPHFSSIIKLLNFRALFPITYTDYEDCLNNWIDLSNSLMDNRHIKSLIHILLSIGNIINTQNLSLCSARAYNIRILSQLSSLKCARGGRGVLEVVCEIFYMKYKVTKIVNLDILHLLSDISQSNFTILETSVVQLLKDFEEFETDTSHYMLNSLFKSFHSENSESMGKIKIQYDECKYNLSRCHEYYGLDMIPDDDGCFMVFKILLEFIKHTHEALDKLTS